MFFSMFALSLFVFKLVNSRTALELYTKEQLRLQNPMPTDNSTGLLKKKEKIIKIESINKTVDNETVILYLIFNDPSLKKETTGWSMSILADLSVIDKDNHSIIKSIVQNIDKTYSYEPDSGSFVFRLNLPQKAYNLKFVVTDRLSGRKAEEVVTLKF